MFYTGYGHTRDADQQKFRVLIDEKWFTTWLHGTPRAGSPPAEARLHRIAGLIAKRGAEQGYVPPKEDLYAVCAEVLTRNGCHLSAAQFVREIFHHEALALARKPGRRALDNRARFEADRTTLSRMIEETLAPSKGAINPVT